MAKQKSLLLERWKKYTMKVVRRRFGDTINMAAVEKYLDKQIEENLHNPKCYWINSFRERVVNTDALAAIQSVDDCNHIVGGAGAVFAQHDYMPNPMRDFILWLRNARNEAKRERGKYDRVKDADAWSAADTRQLNLKIVSNSLYGVLGYAKFILFNIALAESITRMGRVIISTASCGFENFLADSICLSTPSEVYEYINNIMDEYDDKYKDFDFSIFGVTLTPDQVYERIIDKCAFPIDATVMTNIRAIINRADDGARFMLFYKNNFYKFNRIPIIKQKLMYIISGIPELNLPSLEKIENEQVRSEVEDLWKFYDMAVFYNYPIYDSVRKMAYGNREAVLYIDTDSNFIALNKFVQQIRHEFFNDHLDRDPMTLSLTCANVLIIYLSIVVDRNLKMLARNCHISDKWAKYLSMKNEFIFKRVLFGDVKKRYIDLQTVQEGKILNDGKGVPEIKGYDFRKSVTKSYVRDYYTNLCMDEILTPDEIDLKSILKKVFALKKEIRRSMEAGESMYFKQANVSVPEHYVDPLRISGIKGVLLWNALCPDYAIELPSDVDLIPIRNLSTEKNRVWFKNRYPDTYARLEREIFQNRNPNIAQMSLNIIAKPKNANIPMPDWLKAIMDVDKIVNSTVKLITPIMESLGIKVQKVTSQKEILTNIVDL